MTISEGYKIVFEFLDTIYFRTHPDDLGGILGSMQLDEDDRPMDDAMSEDWLEAVRMITNDEKLSVEQVYDAMIGFLKGVSTRNSLKELQELAGDLETRNRQNKFQINMESDCPEAVERGMRS
jgi:hypothetical protein